MRVVLLGPPGSGKGTQSALLKEQYGAQHVASGDLLREAVEHHTPLGKKAREFMDAGQLVPDDLVLGMVRERLARSDCRNGFVLDGFPRTPAQAEELHRILVESGRPLDHVIAFEVPREQILERLVGRRSCPDPECGRTYHLKFKPPAKADVCDACGHALMARDDDSREMILKRIDVYRQRTRPLREFYRKTGLLREVDGSGAQTEVFGRIQQALATQ